MYPVGAHTVRPRYGETNAWANNVRPYGDAFADGLHEEGYTIALILHPPFSILHFQLSIPAEGKRKAPQKLCGAMA